MKKIQEVIVRPLITERSTLLKEKGKYSFEVHTNATKQEIKSAVESIFKKDKVEVLKVNTTKVPGKSAGSVGIFPNRTAGKRRS